MLLVELGNLKNLLVRIQLDIDERTSQLYLDTIEIPAIYNIAELEELSEILELVKVFLKGNGLDQRTRRTRWMPVQSRNFSNFVKDQHLSNYLKEMQEGLKMTDFK